MAWSDPAKIPPVMVAVKAESVMAILVIGVTKQHVVSSLDDTDDVNGLGSAWSEVEDVLVVLQADCWLLFSLDK